MIDKLHKLKQTQLNQQFAIRRQLISKISELEEKIQDTKNNLLNVSVEKFGAIGDFKILAIHKESMRFQKETLEEQKRVLENELKRYDLIIVEHQKEVEKYSYILKENLKLKIKQEQKDEEIVASEYVQSKYIKRMLENA